MRILKSLFALFIAIIVVLGLFGVGWNLELSKLIGDKSQNGSSYEPLEPVGQEDDVLEGVAFDGKNLDLSEEELSDARKMLIGDNWELTASGMNDGERTLIFRRDYGRSEVVLDDSGEIVELDMKRRDIPKESPVYNQSEAVERAETSLNGEGWILEYVEIDRNRTDSGVEKEFEFKFQRSDMTAEVEIGGSSGEVVAKELTKN